MENIVIENPSELLWFAIGVIALWIIYKILQRILKKYKKNDDA